MFGIKIHNNSMPGEGEISSFCLDIGRIIDCHFYIVLMGTLGVNIFSKGRTYAEIVVMSKI